MKGYKIRGKKQEKLCSENLFLIDARLFDTALPVSIPIFSHSPNPFENLKRYY